MNIHQALAALTLLVTLSTALALMGGAEVEYVHSTGPKMYCGRYLARTLARVCEQLETEGLGKRGGSMYNSILSPVYDEQELGWPWIGRLKARTIGSSRGKRGGAVVSECCEKGCSYDELVTYC